MRLQVQSLALLTGLRIQHCLKLHSRRKMRLGSGVAVSWNVGHRCYLDLVLLWLWLWHRLAATPPVRPLAWEPPYAMDMALKRQKEKKGQKK